MTDDPYSAFLGNYIAQQEAPAIQEDSRPGEWRTLWTWVELAEGEILPASLELLGRAREIADELGTRNCAVLFGEGVTDAAARLGEYGADRVFLVDAPEFSPFNLDIAREALTALVRDRRPEAMLFPATIQGRNLGAQLSMTLGTGIVPNCNRITLDPTERTLIGQQTSFEERLLSEVLTPTQRPQVFTVTPGSFRRPGRESGKRAQVVPVPAMVPTRARTVKELAREPDAPKRIEQYDALVAAGLGIASKQGFQQAQALANELNAFAGSTRAGVACGWAEPDSLITATRHRLRPRLYVAAGVVGEYDHLKAIEGADFVIALVPGANVPIAEQADLIAVGDPPDLLARIVDHLQKAKSDRFAL